MDFCLKLWFESQPAIWIPSRNTTPLIETVFLNQWSWPPREKVSFLASQLSHPATRSMTRQTTGQQYNLCLQRLSGNILVFTSAMEGQLWRGLTALLWPWSSPLPCSCVRYVLFTFPIISAYSRCMQDILGIPIQARSNLFCINGLRSTSKIKHQEMLIPFIE